MSGVLDPPIAVQDSPHRSSGFPHQLQIAALLGVEVVLKFDTLPSSIVGFRQSIQQLFQLHKPEQHNDTPIPHKNLMQHLIQNQSTSSTLKAYQRTSNNTDKNR
ncbi:hypothetical protein KC19_VG123000 [Ceratodon purpureus]|uniref:Uncharacterized protein n=1 Tax=Ceratodon purpureus TaxID=3225 RepID=A0A8T0HPJ9_CERPU|nr:hypothetical protein KC19_VG123000 [Ceratodon purpureus]